MKNLLFLFMLLGLEILFVKISVAQNTFPSSGAAGIGTTSPNASSLLDIVSTSKGILIPRMTKVQRDAIAAPIEGLMIYQTNSTPGFYYYDGSAWKAISTKGASKSLDNLTTPTAVNVDLLPATDNSSNLGSANNSWKDAYLDGSVYMDGHRFLANGNFSTALGDSALISSSGAGNTAIGFNAMFSNTTGYQNVACGGSSLYSNTEGYNNTATGRHSLYSNTTGIENTADGTGALFTNGAGNDNTALGFQALNLNTSSNNTAVGSQALLNNSTGFSNVAMGNDAGRHNTTGSINVFIGDSSGVQNTSGIYNTFVGGYAGTYTTGSFNTLIGEGAGSNTKAGRANSFVGVAAGFGNGTGNVNTYLGDSSGYFNSSGRANTMVGYQAGLNNTTDNNSCFGYRAGFSVTSGDLNTFIGHNADCGSLGTLTNSTAIGNGASVTISNCVVLGNSSVTKIGVGIIPTSGNVLQFAVTTAKLTNGGAWTNASDRKLKDGFEKLKSADILDKVNQLDIERWHYIADHEPVTHIGPIAEDFHQLFNVGDDTTISTIDPAGVALIAIQELSKKNDELSKGLLTAQSRNESLESAVSGLQQEVADLKSTIGQSQPEMNDGFAKLGTLNSKPETILGQNIPNPFDNSTLIPFRIPKNCHDASIMVNNISTSEVVSVIPISCNEDHVSIDAGVLASGTYTYTLYVDGKMIETKNMELIK